MAKGGQGYNGMGDMMDGGGAGKSGPQFQGGPFSGALNDMGVKPLGSLTQQQPQMQQPQQPQQMPASAPQQAAQPQYSGRGDYGMPGGTGVSDQVTPEYYQRLMARAMQGDAEAIRILNELRG